MCGIFYYENRLTKYLDMKKLKRLQETFYKSSHRGPDNSIFLHEKVADQFSHRCFGFHRLSINGLSSIGNQPLKLKNCTLICNGEIYNYKELIIEFNLEEEYNKGGSDCEIVIHLFRKIGMKEALKRLDGVFALTLVDHDTNAVYVARDPFGIRSLFYGSEFGFAADITVSSEIKSMDHCLGHYINQFPSGCYGVYQLGYLTIHPYYSALHSATRPDPILEQYVPYNYVFNTVEDSEENICANIKTLLESAVEKRLMSERGAVGCLLSGGLDSTLVTAIMCKFMDPSKLNTYSIGLKGSVDLMWARRAANYLGTRHHEVCLSEQEFLDAIEDTVYQIESYDTTSVRASLPNFLISKYISQHSDDVVIFCGDMSDEIFGSYRGFTKAPSDEDFKRENERMIRDVRYFDLLRSDKTISGAGLEARVPFADKAFLKYAMEIPPRYKRFDDERIEKYLLRKAFDGQDYLPDDLLWRRKEAFSDGVSGSSGRTWVQMIKEHVETRVTDVEYDAYVKTISELKNTAMNENNLPYDKESFYYRKIFENFFHEKSDNAIPYYWRHPFCSNVDPSARLLEFYKQ
jgi:asparagine synthase (glutamine-hydrolysing)